MRTLKIDFAPRRGWWDAGVDRKRRPLWVFLCVLLAAALVATLSLIWQFDQQRSAALARLSSAQAALDASQAGDEDNTVASTESAEAVAQARTHLNYPWANLLGTLEHKSRPAVTLLSLEMGAVRQSNKLVIETQDAAVALDYLKDLKASPEFANLALVRQETTVGEGGQRLRFTFEAAQAGATARQAVGRTR